MANSSTGWSNFSKQKGVVHARVYPDDWQIAQAVGPNALLVLIALRSYCSESRPYCWPSLGTLADQTGQTIPSVRAALAKLCSDKMPNQVRIYKVPRRNKNGQQTSSDYWLRPWTNEEFEERYGHS